MTDFMFLTLRCRIRTFREEDLDAFMAYRNDAYWMRYQGFKGFTKEQYRRALLGGGRLEAGMQLAVVSRASGMLLGDLYVKREGEACWIGCTIGPEYACQGYAQESIQGLLDWLKSNSLCACVFAGVCPENEPSNALMRKMGFRYLRFDPANAENLYRFDLTEPRQP